MQCLKWFVFKSNALSDQSLIMIEIGMYYALMENWYLSNIIKDYEEMYQYSSHYVPANIVANVSPLDISRWNNRNLSNIIDA